MIARELSGLITRYREKFPVLTLTGVRQCGKSTLLRACFPKASYVSLEDPDIRALASEDPRGFLKQYPYPCVIDEAQRVPELFSYLQTIADEAGQTGMYILSGSHNFLLMQGISQSLAGRTAVLHLLPLSLREKADASVLESNLYDTLFYGGYPALYDRDLTPGEYFPSYVQTYIERDVRLLRNISDADAFMRFVRICASRSGQIVNYADMALACGITVPTVRAWLSILETGNLVFLLPPYYRSFEKRIIKSPKLYFYDSGLLCYLLGIETPADLQNSTFLGAVFETMVLSEYRKTRSFAGKEARAYYYRDTNGNEIDLLTEDGGILRLYEIKAGKTMQQKYLHQMKKTGRAAGVSAENMTCIYGGTESVRTAQGGFLSYRDAFS